ncbi:MAG TPA: LPS export ABC transporter periplasmic protein LptC [Pyrinomonadaceae bacterium]|nr:LPS export ABC transporter periplasmic protein LptC [Pyrinomonadaceae bacterium]
MQEIRPRKRVSVIGLRAFAPKAVRVVALVLLVAGVGAVVVSYLRLKDRPVFRLRSGPAQLSKEVVGVIDNFERREMKGDRLHVLLRATRDVAFSDGHHELENVHLEVYPDEGEHPDKIVARRTISNEDNTQFVFTGEVVIETRDRLVARTEAAEYDTKTRVGNVTAPVQFARENVSGRADAATLEAEKKLLELRGGVEITVQPDAEGGQAETGGVPHVNLRGRPVTVKSGQAVFEQGAMRLSFMGGATAEQGPDLMSGETMTGFLSEQKRVRLIETHGNSYLRSLNEGRAAEVFSGDMFFHFDPEQKLVAASAQSNVRARTLDADSEARLEAPASATLAFEVQGERSLLKSMRADGRAVVTMAAPKSKAADPRAANKRLTGDNVLLFWRTGGRDLERAEAVGNAELLVEPANPGPEADRKMLFAERFDCDFYEAGNLARHFKASGGQPRAVVEPLRPAPNRQTRTLTSPVMTAQFVRETQDVERVEATGGARFTEGERTLTSQQMTAGFGAQQALERVEAAGDAKFNERDRNGQSATMSYTAKDEVVRLRGGEPVVWDSRARLRANEIDSDARQKISYGRGRVQTTYYSQEQTNGAAPFRNTKSPVFIASQAAEFQHEARVGVYTGAARAWQDDNFVRADRIILRDEQKRMDAEGSVQSALYNARRKEPSGERVIVPVFATSRRMSYADAERLLHYEEDVDIKQGTERITGGVADVYLMKDTYEVERTVAQRQVVVTQPGRRGTGDWAQYTAADETVVLTGNPARVEDAERGTNESRRMTIHLREDRVVSDGGTGGRQSTGRVRSTHKIRKQ